MYKSKYKCDYDIIDNNWIWPYDYTKSINNIKYYNISEYYLIINPDYYLLYSLWNNFLDVCNNNYDYEYENINKYTNKKRLKVFINLYLVK
jgi:hypothetical protein